MTPTTRTKLALDHGLPLIRAGLAATLSSQADMTLMPWRVEDGLRGLDPEVRVLVLDLPTGLRLAAALRHGADEHRCQIMIVTEQAGEWAIRQAMSQGVLGFHLIDSPLDRLVTGVRLLADGRRSFDDAVAAHMAECLMRPLLTGRERDVLDLLAKGLCNKEVAKRLDIALGTVKGHVRVLLDKLGVHSRVQAVIVARQRGLVGPRDPVHAAAHDHTTPAPSLASVLSPVGATPSTASKPLPPPAPPIPTIPTIAAIAAIAAIAPAMAPPSPTVLQ